CTSRAPDTGRGPKVSSCPMRGSASSLGRSSAPNSLVGPVTATRSDVPFSLPIRAAGCSASRHPIPAPREAVTPGEQEGPRSPSLHQGREAHPQGGHMARSIELTACLLVLAGCGGGSGDLKDVELQVINAVSNDINRNLTLRVETPHDTP